MARIPAPKVKMPTGKIQVPSTTPKLPPTSFKVQSQPQIKNNLKPQTGGLRSYATTKNMF